MSPEPDGSLSTALAEPVIPGGLRRSEFRAMGTDVSVLASDAAVGAAAGQVERLFEEWEERLSRFRPDSELSRLNASPGRPVIVGELLLRVISAALRAALAGLFTTPLGERRAAGSWPTACLETEAPSVGEAPWSPASR
jgi:thiamine biosynthesis lipoprotein